MKKVKFVIQLGLAVHEVVEEFENDVTKAELDDSLNRIVWEQIDAYYNEIKE